MELRVLHYFLAVARHENITKAADELHLTQPTLSRQLSDLEKELGTTLFLRGKRRTLLTEEGLFLKKRAEEIITLADRTLEQFTCQDNLMAGDIYIGSGETAAIREIITAIAPLFHDYPHIRFHFTSGNEKSILEQLEKGLLDFGLLCRSLPPRDYAYRTLGHKDIWGLFLHKNHPLAEKDSITPEDLEKEPLIISIQALEAKEFDHWFGKNISLSITATYDLPQNAAYLVEQGLGSLLTFRDLLPAGNSTVHPDLLFRPLSPSLYSDNYIIWKKNRAFSKAARLAEACFTERFQS